MALRGSSSVRIRRFRRWVLPTRALKPLADILGVALRTGPQYGIAHRRFRPNCASARRSRDLKQARVLAVFPFQIAGKTLKATLMIMSCARSISVRKPLSIKTGDIRRAG